MLRRLLCVAFACAVTVPATASALEPLRTIGGTEGGGAGRLYSPFDSGVGPSGNLYVADGANHRISVFDPLGRFLFAFGRDVVPGGGTGAEVCTRRTGCKAALQGGGPGELWFPYGIAIDAAGRVFVADTKNRISVFGPRGRFLRAFGKDVVPGNAEAGSEVCTPATGCQEAAYGAEAGELGFVTDVGLAPGGLVVVADDGNYRVSVFTRGGAFVRAFGKNVDPAGGNGPETCTAATGCQGADTGFGPGEFEALEAIDVDPEGNVYVADDSNHRVSVHTSGGAFRYAFGKDVSTAPGTGFEVCLGAIDCKPGEEGAAAGELGRPQGLAADPRSGLLFVADGESHRIAVFRPDGAATSFVRAFGHDVIPGGGTGFEVCTTGTGCKQGTPGAAPGQLYEPHGVAVDCRGGVYVASPFPDTIQHVGESERRLPPCSRAPLRVVRVQKRRNGTALLVLAVDRPGRLTLRGRGARPVTKRIGKPGRAKLLVRARGRALRRLGREGRVRVRLNLRFDPAFGNPRARSRALVLRRTR